MMTGNEFSDEMWFTYKARFNAHARLMLQDAFYLIITSVLSIFIITVNILQLAPELITMNQSATTCYTISLSIIILVISTVFALSNKKKQAERFHSCALEIHRIYREYKIKQNELTDNEVKEYAKRYDDVLAKYDINHSRSDWIKVSATKGGTKIWVIPSYYIMTFFVNYFLLILLLIVPIIAGIFIIVR
jgi:hypothetical protein